MPSLLLALSLLTAAEAPPDTLVVCPAELQRALAPWLEYRERQGHRLVVLDSQYSAEQLRDEVRRRAKRGGLATLVLVGDAVGEERPDGPDKLRVPTRLTSSRVVRKYGSEPTIASDNYFADLDDDGLPELAVGRLSVDRPEQLAQLVAKILAYEQSTDFGLWRRHVNLVAGVGGFGALADATIETAARRIITSGVPTAYTTRLTYGNWRSPYCPDPLLWRATILDSLSEGSLCWVYMGHAWPGQLADLQIPGGAFRSVGHADMAQVRSRAGAPIACLLACYTGAFDQPDDCLAESMLLQPGGPVAVLGGSRVTMPYAMSVLGCELMRELFERKPATIGAAVMRAKRQMVAPDEKTSTRAGLDAVAALVNPGQPRDELLEHVWLFNLLGDPLLRLKWPEEVQIECRLLQGEGVSPAIEIRARSPIAGKATFELRGERGRLTFRPPPRERFEPTVAVRAEYAETYRKANEESLVRLTVPVRRGAFQNRLELVEPLPTTTVGQLKGRYHVCVYIEGSEGCAVGSREVEREAAAEASLAKRPGKEK